jgi:predicted metal-dependent phosphoesterase TrpH
LRFRIPWTPIAISFAVLLSSSFAISPVRDAATLGVATDAYLTRPTGYVALAPLSNVLDTLTLLSVRQHIALVLGVIVLFAVARVVKNTRSSPGWRAHLLATVTLLVAILAVYAASALLPRPMAALVADNANILIADFHSHTSASHDGRGNVERNRDWHRDGGYHVAYVTDHGSVAGAERGIVNNPTPAAAGVTLLQGIEVTWTGEHVTILGAERIYKGLLTNDNRDVDESALALGSLVAGREPIVVWNHPWDLSRLPVAMGPAAPGIRAIELANGSPADLKRVRAGRDRIVAFAQSNNLAMTCGSDNHGWGRTAPCWTILLIVDWRGLQGDALATRIEEQLRANGHRSTRVIERRVADPGPSLMTLSLTVGAVPFTMLSTISNEERVVWLAWTWLIWGGFWWWKRPRVANT